MESGRQRETKQYGRNTVDALELIISLSYDLNECNFLVRVIYKDCY